jgi:hypothetical protein
MAFPTIRFNNLSHLTDRLPRSHRFATGSNESRNYYQPDGGPREKFNSGDEWAAAVRVAKPKGPAARPCGLRVAEWPLCHERCYLRHKCGAALAADLQFNLWD